MPKTTLKDSKLIALGIQQPWAELILRGHKTIEVRWQHAQPRTILLYSSKKADVSPDARMAAEHHGIVLDALPTGRLVGTVDIVASAPCTVADSEAACVPAPRLKGKFGWQLENPQPFEEPIAVRVRPFGPWFYPFRQTQTKK